MLSVVLYVPCSLDRSLEEFFYGAKVQNIKLTIAKKKLLITAPETVLHVAG